MLQVESLYMSRRFCLPLLRSDSTSARTLAITVGTDGAVDVESCVEACFDAGYPIAGLEFADQCCTLLFYWISEYVLISDEKFAAWNLIMEGRRLT